MGIEAVRAYFKERNLEERVIELKDSSATVALAAKALGCEEAQIAKTMSFLVEGKPLLILLAGDVKIDNGKYKRHFRAKAKMIPQEDLVELIGHPMGGVCPFAIREGVPVYLDESLKKLETLYPAAGTANSAVRLQLEELETLLGSSWVDVSKSAL